MKTLTNEQLEWLHNLEPFESIDSIPYLPVTEDEEEYKKEVVATMIKLGAIPKSELEIGATYAGSCRNSSKATWNGKEFEYERYKWGTTYQDTIKHFEDDLIYDVFIPITKI